MCHTWCVWFTHGLSQQSLIDICAPFFPRHIPEKCEECFSRGKGGLILLLGGLILVSSYSPIWGTSYLRPFLCWRASIVEAAPAAASARLFSTSFTCINIAWHLTNEDFQQFSSSGCSTSNVPSFLKASRQNLWLRWNPTLGFSVLASPATYAMRIFVY